MAKTYSASKHLYTLNQSKISESESASSANSSEDEESSNIISQLGQKEMHKLVKKNEELMKMIGELQLKNQQLFELNQLGEKRNSKHEQKQRDLIKKLSYFQVNNKQLTYEIRKVSQDLVETRQNKKISENQMSEVKQTIKKSLYQKQRFILFIRNLLEMLKKCERQDEFLVERDKILSFLQRNIASSENNHKITCEFDLKFELSRVDTLKQRIKALDQQLAECRSIMEREKIEKKKIIATYNEKITKLRQLYDNLKQKIDVQQVESKRKIKTLLVKKNEQIESLKDKLKESRTRKSSVDIKKSRESKKSFIGDGDYSHLELTELNEAIEHLEIQIIKQFQQ